MPSTNKTSFLLLNKWVASDAPKMADFNSDNQKIDDAVKGHCEDANLHLTAAQKAWVAAPNACGSYSGTGTDNRTVSLGYTPAFLAVFAVGYGPVEFNPGDSFSVVRYGMAAPAGGSFGVALAEGGFTVRQHQNDPIAGMARLNLNESGVTYVYFAIK